MKKFITIMLLLIYSISFAQKPKGSDIEVAKADIAFNRNIPVGFYIWEVDSGKIYRINTKMYSATDSMATVFRDGNYTVFGGSNGITSGSDQIALDSINNNIRPFITQNRDSINTFSPLIRGNQAKVSFPGFSNLSADYGFSESDPTIYSWAKAATKPTYTYTEVGADAAGAAAAITLGGLGGVPTSTTVNGHALTGNISVTASDVGLGNVENAAASTLYEPIFSKNTGFNKDFGTTSGTVVQGNDSRIVNGQTAYGWGDWATNLAAARDSIQMLNDSLNAVKARIPTSSSGGISYEAPQVLTGTTPTWDASTSHNAKITTSGATTITLSTFEDGSDGFLTAVNGGGDGFTFAYTGKAINYTNGVLPTSDNINSTAGNITVFGIKISGDTVNIGFNTKEKDKIQTLSLSDLASNLAVTDTVGYLMFSNSITITEVGANVLIPGTGSTINVDIEVGGTSILSTGITIDSGEKTSETATTPAVISTTSVSANTPIVFNITQVGSTTAGKALQGWIKYY